MKLHAGVGCRNGHIDGTAARVRRALKQAFDAAYEELPVDQFELRFAFNALGALLPFDESHADSFRVSEIAHGLDEEFGPGAPAVLDGFFTSLERHLRRCCAIPTGEYRTTLQRILLRLTLVDVELDRIRTEGRNHFGPSPTANVIVWKRLFMTGLAEQLCTTSAKRESPSKLASEHFTVEIENVRDLIQIYISWKDRPHLPKASFWADVSIRPQDVVEKVLSWLSTRGHP